MVTEQFATMKDKRMAFCCQGEHDAARPAQAAPEFVMDRLRHDCGGFLTWMAS